MLVEPPSTVEALVSFLAGTVAVFDSLGPDGDPIDIFQHSLQCAHVLAARRPDDVELQVAGLVHDLGHVADPDDPTAPVTHGEIGGAFVEPLLGRRVARLVALHVPAKRYLVATDTAYRNRLSDGSAYSLGLQGGGMSDAEVARFEEDPNGPDAAVLRQADEAAKVIGRVVPGLDTWVPVLRDVAAGAAARD